MADAIRRAHARIPCDRPAELSRGAAFGRRLGEGRLLNISLSGAFMSFDGELERGTPYRLRIEGPEGPLDLPCRVAREGAKASGVRHYGLSFNVSADQEKLLRRLVDAIRRQPLADKESRLDRSLRDYWNL